MIYQIFERRVIDTDMATLNRLLFSPDMVPQWFEGWSAIQTTGDFPNVGSLMKMTYRVMNIEFRNSLTVMQHTPNKLTQFLITGMIKGTFEWFIKPQDDGIELQMVVDYHMNSYLLGKAAPTNVHSANVRMVQRSLQKLKAMAETAAPV